MAKFMNGNLHANKFKLQSCYYVHFRTGKEITVMAKLLNDSLQ